MTTPSAATTAAVLIEAFTEQPCSGNGAAVVLLDQPASDGWMQRLARSLNQSETAFLLPRRDGWALRWFTPTCEVPLCGHATLAALLALQHWQRLDASGSTTLWSRSGPLAVAMHGALGQLHLPSAPLQAEPMPAALAAVLQDRWQTSGQEFWRSGLGYSVVLLSEAVPMASLPSLAADLDGSAFGALVLMQPLSGAPAQDCRVNGCAADYQLRFFAPALGIAEDPVTGSAHALVAPYWLEALAQTRVVGWQCSPRPGGMICEAASSGMIRLSGSGVLLWSGDLHLVPEHWSGAAERWQQLCGND
jgi:PhzF family phenazine biosynthesis protein